MNSIVEKAKQVLTEMFIDDNLATYDGTIWEVCVFGKIYGTFSRYFHYGATPEMQWDDYHFPHKEVYGANDSYNAFLKEFKEDGFHWCGYIFTEYGIITHTEIMLNCDELPERIKKTLVLKENQSHYSVAKFHGGGIYVKPSKVKVVGEEVKDNYNNDLPYDSYFKFIESDDSGIAMLHGLPGTGKSYFLRYLINKYPNTKFIKVDKEVFDNADSETFSEFLDRYDKAVYIIEDSETIIRSRENGINDYMPTILNLTDGLESDEKTVKFIFTYNTSDVNVDEALKRKGRTKITYEFKELELDKVANLFKKFGITDKPNKKMRLCDIYHYKDANGNEKKYTKIGF